MIRKQRADGSKIIYKYLLLDEFEKKWSDNANFRTEFMEERKRQK